MQICSAHDGPLCSATGHNKNYSDQVPCCYLTQCEGDDRSWLEKKKGEKPQQDKSEKEHLRDYDSGASSRTNCDVSYKNRHVPLKTFTSKLHSVYSIRQSYFNPHKTSFPPDIVSLQGFDTTLPWQISLEWYKMSKNSTVAKGEEAEIGRRGGCVCLRQLTWNKGPEDISHPSSGHHI